MASILVTPFVLYFSLPKCAPAILAFIRDFTVHVPGVGDICSLAAFDFERHGNPKYGSPARAPKVPARAASGPLPHALLALWYHACHGNMHKQPYRYNIQGTVKVSWNR